MKTSKFCICARGFAVHSPHIVESLYFNCVPVIISDNYVPPLFNVLNWESFAVFISEKDIPKLKAVLLSISEDKYVEMYERVRKVKEHFFWHSEPVKYDLFHMILHSVWYNRVYATGFGCDVSTPYIFSTRESAAFKVINEAVGTGPARNRRVGRPKIGIFRLTSRFTGWTGNYFTGWTRFHFF
ncbi:hypothetical protein R6Q57_003999 [Mikania cordata]